MSRAKRRAANGGNQQPRELHSHAAFVDMLQEKANKPLPTKYKPQPIGFKTKRQQQYHNQILANQIVVGCGPAGTSKTYVAVYCALVEYALGNVDKIIITKPTVEVGGEMGAMPGDVDEKMAPFTASILDCFHQIIGEPATNELYHSKHVIKVLPLQHMRGITFHRAFIIADEMQNAHEMQTRMLLTRLSDDAKLVINGDMDQSDLPRKSGLPEALEIIKELKEEGDPVDVTEFTIDDVVRGGLTGKIVKKYYYRDKEKQKLGY